MDKEKDTGKNLERDSEEYSFISEKIKERPINKKAVATRIAVHIGTGILFGLAAALVFAAVAPQALKKFASGEEPPRVDIPADQEPEPTAVPEETPVPTPEEVARPVTMEDYEQIYRDVLQVAEKPRKALVVVSGIESKTDLLDSSYLSTGQASGAVIYSNGLEYFVLTESKVTKEAQSIQVTFCDGTSTEAAVKKSDPATGLTVLSVDVGEISEETKKEVQIGNLGNSYSLIQGKPVIAIGSPSGYNDSVSYGTITSVSTKVAVVDAEYNLLTTDILGSSTGGGVLLDTKGDIIGIINQSYGKEETQNMVVALAVSQLKPLIENLSNGEDIMYMGIKGQDVTEALSKSTGIPKGVWVDKVEAESPAMEAGIQNADVIEKFNKKTVSNVQAFYTELQKCRQGQKVPVAVKRKGADGYVAMEFIVTIKAV